METLPQTANVESQLTRIFSLRSWQSQLKKVTDVLEGCLTEQDINFIASCSIRPMRNLEPVRLKATLMKTLSDIAALYANSGEVDARAQAYAFNECTEAILQRFKGLAVDELLFAWRLKESGVIKVKGAETYGGFFSAGIMTKVLGEYVVLRRKVLSPIAKMIQQEIQEQAEEVKHRQGREWFEQNFVRFLREADTKYLTYNDIPHFWCDAARERKLIEISKEQGQSIYERALNIAKAAKGEHDTKQLSLHHSRREDYNLEEQAKVIAKKIAVWELLIKDKNSKIWK